MTKTEPLTRFSTFDRLSIRYRIRGRLVTETGIRIGAGKAFDASTTDAPVMRDALGRIFLPGSSLKGVLRSGLEAVLRGLDHPGLWACDPFESKCTARLDQQQKRGEKPTMQEVLDSVCTVCGLFGSTWLAGRVFIADLPLADDRLARTEVRDGVGIDRDLRVAQTRPAVKYDQEVVAPGTAFRLEMILENVDDDVQLGLVLKALQLLDEGEIRLGGLTSRGLGRVSLQDLRLERTDARRLLDNSGYEDLDYPTMQAKTAEQLVARLWPQEA